MTDISGDCPRCGRCEGYGCSCTTEEQQSAHIDQLLARIAELEAAIKRQARVARTLRDLTLAEVRHLQDKDRAEYFAAKTLDSEREANEILTNRVEQLEAALTSARDAALREASTHLAERAKATPLGHESPRRGASTYNWLAHNSRLILDLINKEPKP